MVDQLYEEYLKKEKKLSDNTSIAYLRDINGFSKFISERNIGDLKEVNNSDIMAYAIKLKQDNVSKSTVNRKIASIRTYYRFLMKYNFIKNDPTADVKTPRIEKKEIEFISIEEMEKVLSLPDDSEKGKRDRAILELLYATGIRASEIIELKMDDLNLRMGFIKCQGPHSKSRIIPMGRYSRKAMEDYVFDVRSVKSDYVFVNYLGEKMTRQGLWKILKEYGVKAELSLNLTPQVIRNSFAVHMLQNGADLKSLQELMGHDDIAATQAYLAVTKNRIKDVYDRTHPRA